MPIKKLKRDPVEVGKRINHIRTNVLGLSMADFGALIDDKVQSGTIANWETGKNLPNNQRLKIIASLANKTVDELLFGNQDDVLKQFIITLVKSNEFDLLNRFIEYLKITNTQFNDFTTSLTYDKDSDALHSYEQHEEAVRETAFELFEEFINKNDVNKIKYVTGTKFLKRITENDSEAIAIMVHKYIDYLLLISSLKVDGKINKLLSLMRNELSFNMTNMDNIESYISFMLDINDNKDAEEKSSIEKVTSNAIESFYSEKVDNTLKVSIKELKAILSEYNAAKDKYLNNDNQ